jgi:hypothetical protein
MCSEGSTSPPEIAAAVEAGARMSDDEAAGYTLAVEEEEAAVSYGLAR